MAKIGILNVSRAIGTGGVFHYITTLLSALNNDAEHEYVIFYNDPEFKEFCADHSNCKFVPVPLNKNIFFKAAQKFAGIFDRNLALPGLCRAIKENQIDLLIDPYSSSIGFYLKIPTLGVIYDLMHRYYPGFPEYSLRERFMRELSYKQTVRHCAFTMVDSMQTKNELARFYNAKPDNIMVIPYCPPAYIYKYQNLDAVLINETMSKYKIPEKFIFYPAQFWSHKNHLRLIQALYRLKNKHGLVIPAVFAGSFRKDSRGTFPELVKLIAGLGMGKQIFFPGYVSQQEIVALYKRSTALVFPSLIGPTNIPPLEAMFLGTPVLCSDLFSMPEQVAKAAFLFDPFDVSDIAEKIFQVWNNEGLRINLIKEGYSRVRGMGIDRFGFLWKQAIKETLNRAAA